MKKFKKYLLMIPLLAVMLLNCVCYGQVIFSANAIDYSDYFKPVEDCPHTFDFTDVDTILSEMNLSKPYYFYCVKIDSSNYSKYLSGQSYSLTFQFYSFSSSTPSHQSSCVLHYSAGLLESYFKYDSSSNSYSNFQGSSGSNIEFLYFLNTGTVDYDFTYGFDFSEFKDTNYCDECYYYFQYTNIPDFPLFYDYESSQSAMNVNVTFSPEFNGEISRTVKVNGTTTTLETFNMTVTNNSKFNIQYLMAIYPSTDYFSPFQNDPGIAGSWAASTPNGKTYVGNPTYVYVKDEWIYLPHGEQGVITGYAPSSWHYLNSGATDDVTINFNQLKLDSTMIYEVSVYAVRNDYDYVSPYTDLASFQWGSDYCIDSTGCERVYDSVFRLLNPATFNPNNNEGSYAFDVDDTLLFNRANGYIDENGEVVIDRVDTNHLLNAGTDPDDPWRGWNDDDSAWEVYNKNQNTVSSDISQLSNNFGSFFRFINKVYSYFPKNYQTTIILGLTAVVVIAILKVVF